MCHLAVHLHGLHPDGLEGSYSAFVAFEFHFLLLRLDFHGSGDAVSVNVEPVPNYQG